MIRTMMTENDRLEAKHALYAVFRSFDYKRNRIFSGHIQRAAVISPSDWMPYEEQYDAIVHAANHVNDDRAYYSYVEGILNGGRGFYPELTVSVELQTGQTELIHQSLVHVNWMSAMYSSTGQWGLLTTETFAVIGGCERFMDTLGQHLDLDEMAVDYLQYWLNWSSADMEWVFSLAERCYGKEKAEVYLDRARTEPFPYA